MDFDRARRDKGRPRADSVVSGSALPPGSANLLIGGLDRLRRD